jgi:hypothetical protein
MAIILYNICKDYYKNSDFMIYIMDKTYAQVCYSAGCNNLATIALKIPLSSRIQCIIHVCSHCLRKYELDDSDKLQHQHQRLK